MKTIDTPQFREGILEGFSIERVSSDVESAKVKYRPLILKLPSGIRGYGKAKTVITYDPYEIKELRRML